MSNIHVNTIVNGDEVGFLCDPRETLLDCLRDKLSLTGAKEGCDHQDWPYGHAKRCLHHSVVHAPF